MITLLEIVQALTPYPNVYMTLTYEQLSVFFDITLRFMPLIMTSSPRATRGLPALLSDMEDVLSMKLRLPIEDINILWSALEEPGQEGSALEYVCTRRLANELKVLSGDRISGFYAAHKY